MGIHSLAAKSVRDSLSACLMYRLLSAPEKPWSCGLQTQNQTRNVRAGRKRTRLILVRPASDQEDAVDVLQVAIDLAFLQERAEAKFSDRVQVSANLASTRTVQAA